MVAAKLEGGNMGKIRPAGGVRPSHRLFVCGQWVETRALRDIVEVASRVFWNKRGVAPPAAIDGYDFSNARLRARQRAAKEMTGNTKG